MTKRMICVAALGLIALAMAACGDPADAEARPDGTVVVIEEPIRLNGAATVGNFIPELAEAFIASGGNQGVRFIYPESPMSESLASPLDAEAPRGDRVWGDWQGSTWGLKLLGTGEIDMGAMARRPSEAELEKARKAGLAPRLHVLAFDAVAVVAHPTLIRQLAHLTRSQLCALFLTGTLTNWSDLDAALPAKPVRVLASNPAICGTAVAFAELLDEKWAKAHAPGQLFASSVETCELDAVIEAVSKDPLAIGICQFSLVPDGAPVFCVPYLDDLNPASQAAIAPTVESCSDGSYTLQRPLLLVTNGTPTGAANRFIRFAMGPQGREILQGRRCIVPR
jgi:phosphate transport system substrate-binding protein